MGRRVSEADQWELLYESGEKVLIDHADADSLIAERLQAE